MPEYQCDGNFQHQSQNSIPAENTKLFCDWLELMIEYFRLTGIPDDCRMKVQLYIGIESYIGQKVDHAYEI